MSRVGVIGTNSWGTTLAIITARTGHDVNLWARTQKEATELTRYGENSRFLPNAKFPSNLQVTASTVDAFSEADMVIIAVPSSTMRTNIRVIRANLNNSAIIVSASKGLEKGTSRRMTQIIEEETLAHNGICALSGPNLAREIVEGKPSSTVIASNDQESAKRAQEILMSSKFRVYTNNDVIGVEFGGALKNIIAIGAGICDGLLYGDNAKAAFITRGLVEISRLAVAAGAHPLTLSGLAGMGDLIATCSSDLSRNRKLGKELAKGKTLSEIRRAVPFVIEGIDTTAATVKMSQNLGVQMPITKVTYDILHNNLSVDKAVSKLMERDAAPE